MPGASLTLARHFHFLRLFTSRAPSNKSGGIFGRISTFLEKLFEKILFSSNPKDNMSEIKTKGFGSPTRQ
jgi:hypothetical protein